MVKVRCYLTGAVYTAALALPAALLALAMAAFFDRYFAEVATGLIASLGADTRAFASIRWPELAGMVIGLALLMAFLLFARGQTIKRRFETN